MKTWISFLAFVAPLAAIVPTAPGGVFTAAYLPQSAISGANSRYDSVVMITNFRSDGLNPLSSGVYVISPTGQTGIVTSAHGTWGYSSLEIRTGANAITSPTSITSFPGVISFDPRYVHTNPAGRRYDLAVFPISLPGITPVPYLTEPPAMNTLFEIVDYGVPTIVGNPHGAFDGIRRMGNNRFERTGASLGWIGDMVVSRMDPGFAGGFASETILTGGGSGGGTFVDIGGQLYLAGTQVNFSLPGYDYGEVVGATNIGNNDTFISGVLIPTPGTAGLLFMSGLLAGRRRRR